MMQKKLLGNTGIEVSPIGLGTVKFGRNQGVRYPEKFVLPTEHAIQELLVAAQALGINLLDTAPAYGSSEERLGKLLKGTRSNWILSTKVGETFINGESYFDFSAEAIRQSVEQSLRRLNTDYLDIVLVHSNGEDIKLIDDFQVFVTLHLLKQAGLIRAYGMSTKTLAGGMKAVDESDVVMVTYNPIQTDDHAVILHAGQKNKGVLIKKALASGHVDKISLHDPVRTAFSFIFSESAVTSVIIGTLNQEHLRYNVECACNALS
jgi:aryl-alcohol dehydrogenase-like predicted oxidoreductase